MGGWIRHILEGLGYPGVVLLMFLENVFPPIPSEVVMPYAGLLTARGDLALWAVVVAGAAGSVLGAVPLYLLGRWVGGDRLHEWARRHGHWFLVSPRDLEHAEGWFERHGTGAVFLCRLVPGVRSLISIPAGICRMRWDVFLLWTAVGTGLWAGLLAGAGRALGDRWERIGTWIGPLSWVVLGGLAIWYLVYVWRRKRQLRAGRPG